MAPSPTEKAATYRAGYLDEIGDDGIQAVLQVQQRGRSESRIWKITPYWHSWLTGLWHMQTQRTRVWFDGGKLTPDGKGVRLIGDGKFRDEGAIGHMYL